MYLCIHLRDCMSTVPWSLKDNVMFMMSFLLSTSSVAQNICIMQVSILDKNLADPENSLDPSVNLMTIH